MPPEALNKVMSPRQAVQEFDRDGASVGLGGQNIGRCAMAAVHEVIRQGKRNLTLCGCNPSISMDMLVGANMVRPCESGSGNLERFGTTSCRHRKVESGELETEDFSHLSMVSRFLAGEMGLPFHARQEPSCLGYPFVLLPWGAKEVRAALGRPPHLRPSLLRLWRQAHPTLPGLR